MRHLIFKYLNRHYYICNNIVYKKSGKLALTRSKTTLCAELSVVFDLPHRKLKWFIKKWCYKHSPYFDFKDFWEKLYFYGTSITGSTIMDAGYIYAPYVPASAISYNSQTGVVSGNNNLVFGFDAGLDRSLITTAVQHNYTSYTASTFVTGTTMMINSSRYSNQTINQNYYGIIQIGGQ